MYPRDYALMSPCHLFLAIRRRSNNHLTPFREESVHRLGERVKDNLAYVPLMHRDGQKVEVMHSGFVVDADANIAVQGRHVGRHVECDRKRPALSQRLHDALQIHGTDKTSIAAHNPLRARANALDAEYLFHLHNHLCHLTERQSSNQILYNQLKLLVLATVMAYQLTSPASVASSDKSRVDTKLLRRRARVIPSMSSG
ncbi:unnamed protein product [Sphagnum jensenii]|uniref:Uncharacterized protein n=1 Tax=Sphagnum jensenii TaxID=128206 RepID=A0ABP1A9H7_9BRYO